MGWLGDAMVVDKLPMAGRPTDLNNSGARANCACGGCGRGMFGHYTTIYFSLFFSLSLEDGWI